MFTHCASLHYAAFTLSETISCLVGSSLGKKENSYNFFCFQLKLHGALILFTCYFNSNKSRLKASTICLGHGVFFLRKHCLILLKITSDKYKTIKESFILHPFFSWYVNRLENHCAVV